MKIPDLSCVLIHHNRYPDVIDTVNGLIAAGVDPSLLMFVDNSEDPATASQIRKCLPAEAKSIFIPNGGYASAVNSGLEELKRTGLLREFVLVSTHESAPAPDALLKLVQAVRTDSRIGVAGPTLLDLEKDQRSVWSTGGRISQFLRMPQHESWGINAEQVRHTPGSVDRAWLDGSFCLYRSEAVRQVPLDEIFFLYFEDSDCHLRMRNAGWRVVWVPESKVGQSSGGTPPYYLGRNFYIFQDRHGRTGFKHIARTWLFTKTLIREVLRKSPRGSASEYVRGARNSPQTISQELR